MDGTYLTDPHLIVNATGQASNISIITGVNRDEAGVFISTFPSNGSTFASYAAQVLGDVSPDLLSSSSISAFSVSNASSPDVIFNASLAIETEGQFTCLDMAKAFTGAKHNAFASTYSYVFNRTYQPNGYTQPWCMPAATAARPAGDPDSEYYKCHAGEQLVMFGNALRAGQPDRDGRDVPFMQVVVDYWAAFARTGDPNPDLTYLRVRGHTETLQQVESRGKWEPVTAEAPTTRVLQWNAIQVPFGGQDRCDALGVGLNTLEPS
jgi:carboxylesterase type B